MKKTLFIVAGAAILLVIIIAVVVSMSHSSSESQLPSVVADKVKGATVTPLAVGVFIQASSTTDFAKIDSASTASVGSIVKTNANGRALVESTFSHPTALDYNSQVVIKDSDSETKKTNLQLVAGALWARVEKVVSPGSSYQVETSNAVAVVRGTSFGMSYSASTTILLVTQGEVSLYTKDKTTGEAIMSSEIKVSAGQKGTIIGGAKPVLAQQSSSDKKSGWFIFNTSSEATVPGPTGTTAPSKVTTTPGKTNPANTETTPPSNTRETITIGGQNVVVGGGGGGSTDVSNEVKIDSVSPTPIKYGDNTTFVIVKGTNFNRVQSLSVAEDVPPDFEIIDNSTIRFHIGSLYIGKYNVDLLLDDESFVTDAGGLVITR